MFDFYCDVLFEDLIEIIERVFIMFDNLVRFIEWFRC